MTKTNVSEELANKIFKIYQAQEVSEKDVKEIKDLIAKNADVNAYKVNGLPLLHCVLMDGITPISLVEKISKMIINAGYNINLPDDNGTPALFCAVETGSSVFVKQVLGAGADINKQNRRGWTALRLAAENKDTKIAKLLIDNGADLNIQCYNEENTALHVAFAKDDFDTFLPIPK